MILFVVWARCRRRRRDLRSHRGDDDEEQRTRLTANRFPLNKSRSSSALVCVSSLLPPSSAL